MDKFSRNEVAVVREVGGPALRCLVGQTVLVMGTDAKTGCVAVSAREGQYWLLASQLERGEPATAVEEAGHA